MSGEMGSLLMKNNKFVKLASRITAAATIVSMFAMISPAIAADATDMKDTMSRQKISVTGVAHALTMTLPSTVTGTLLSTYAGDWANFAFVSSTCTGGTVANNGTGTNIVNVTLTSCDAAGTLTINFTGDNATSAGSKIARITGTAGITGDYAVALDDDDQVTISATVDPTITFDLDTAETNTDSDAAYAVTLDTLIPGTPKSSGNTSNVEFIWTDLTTNAASGAVVTVKNANGASGLVSASVSADDIDSADGTMTSTVENYGLCVSYEDYAPTAALGTYTAVAPFNDTGCGENDTDNVVGGFTGSALPILNTTGEGILNARAAVSVNANVNTLTNPHDDYADTLTFVATGTF